VQKKQSRNLRPRLNVLKLLYVISFSRRKREIFL
jgi:hypothetical protein